MRLSSLPIGTEFEYKGKKYIRVSFFRGRFKDENNHWTSKTFPKNLDVQVDESKINWGGE